MVVSIGIAIIGAGDLSALVFVNSLLKHSIDGTQIFGIVAVWDSDHQKAIDFLSTFKLSQTICCSRGDDALLRHDVHVAAICGASPAMQPALAAKAIHAGKHVLLVPGYPLSIDYAQNVNLIEAMAAYPSLVCAVASGFYYLPAFRRLRSELAARLKAGPSDDISSPIRSISISATTSPRMLFGSHGWQADSASGGGVLSQLGAPLLDTALALLMSNKETSHIETTPTAVNVQGRTCQLFDDSTNFERERERLWPRTAEDYCWVQIDLKRRWPTDKRLLTDANKKLIQSIVSLEIVSSDTIDAADPSLTISCTTDKSMRFKTDGHSLWFWKKVAPDPPQDPPPPPPPHHHHHPTCSPLIYTDDGPSFDETGNATNRSLLLDSVEHFVELIASELVQFSAAAAASSQSTGTTTDDSCVLFSLVLQKLIKSNSVIDISLALSTQRLIDAVRNSLLSSSAVSLPPVAAAASEDDETAAANNQQMKTWSQCL